METRIENFTESIKQKFDLKEVEAKTYSPLTLAYVGDGVYELIIRTLLLNEGNAPVHKLHKKASAYVKAASQAEMMTEIEQQLTQEEMAVYKRGRNAKSYSSAKNATISEYRHATGFEALIGFLYLEGRYERMMDLVKVGLERLKENEI
jgi:ribonuclease-3 family protein